MAQKPTERFSSRVENYVKSRPSYPPAVLETLQAEYGLTPDSKIADIGSGTGLLAELFLRNGNAVYGVEPNAAMREAGERYLRSFSRFASVTGTAEATTLPDDCADFVTAGQAFHWFDRAKARPEFQRIVRPGGWAALIWNEPRINGTDFLRAYGHLLQTYGGDYRKVVDTRNDTEALSEFFAPNIVQQHTFEYTQTFDYDHLQARLLSSSYVPEADHPRYEAMLAELAALFAAHSRAGKVSFDYDTNLFCARLE